MDKPKKICGAKKRGGGICQRSVGLYPNGRCHLHGGPSPKGQANGNYKHGKYSRYAPAHELGILYERAKQDTDLRDLSDDLALTTALINDRLQAMDTIGGQDFFKELEKISKSLFDAYKTQDLDELYMQITKINDLINKGKDHITQLEMLLKLIEQRRKLSDSQSKRENEQQQFITVMQAMSLLNLFISAVFGHIHSSGTKQAIYQEFERIVHERLSTGFEALPIPDETSGISG